MAFPSLLPHAPSRAQQFFVALMAVWFLISLPVHALAWWGGASPVSLLRAVEVAAFVAIQLLTQHRALGLLRRCRVPPWAKFIVSGVSASSIILVFDATLVSFLAEPGAFVRLPRSLLAVFLLAELPLLTWYITWWLILLIGWTEVSSALVAAGLHGVGLVVLADFIPAYTFGTKFEGWTLFPVAFFSGWGLMLSPGTVAAYEIVPVPGRAHSQIRRAVAWAAPGIVGVIVGAKVSSLVLPMPHCNRSGQRTPGSWAGGRPSGSRPQGASTEPIRAVRRAPACGVALQRDGGVAQRRGREPGGRPPWLGTLA
jgi:hypothetical protein